jgi:uncharacterized membrane protein
VTAPAIILWRGHLNVWLGSIVFIAVAVWLWWLYRRLRLRMSWPRATLLLIPKLIVAVLLLLALFEPVWSRVQRDPTRGRLVTLLDVSSSMDVADDGREPRGMRARKILAQIKDNLPGDVKVEEVEFDTELHKSGAPDGRALPRGTDLADSLLALGERGDTAAALGVVVLTDGGDERVPVTKLPGIPVSIVGIGADPARWDDVAVAELQAPATVEKEVEFEVAVDWQARGLAGKLDALRVALEEMRGGAWQKIAEEPVDLSRGRARTRFKTSSAEPGLRRYRVSTPALPGEVSALNNAREFVVDVQKKSVHVLYFTRELGMDFKLLRSELARDPGLSLTALVRTMSERFTIQGDRLAGDEELEAGFPTSEKTLRLYDCVILGSFPAADWNTAQLAALVKYVEEGGAVVFLGGEKSFGRGGYAGTALAPLFPWSVSDMEPPLVQGEFPVNVPAAAAGQGAVAGVRELLERAVATVESLNNVGGLKPGAAVLLQANLSTRTVPVIAVQMFGKGKVMAVASNTLWKWGTKGEELRSAFGLFWRQAVRDLTGKAEGGRVISVRWDKDGYRPGEQAVAEVRLAGEQAAKQARLAATLAFAGQTSPLAAESVPGQAGVFKVRAQFHERGEYQFRIVVYQGEQVAETYEKVLLIAPRVPEGAHLELDDAYLRQLAEKGGGTYVHEREAEAFVKKLVAGVGQKTVVLESPLAEHGPWYAGILLLALVFEWLLRRRMNLF